MASESTGTAGKVITCKAAVAWASGEPLVIQNVQVDPPQNLEVRVKILFTSICHTDLSAWKSELGLQEYPRIYGHEAAGVVESVGEGVEDLRAGDHVVPLFKGECGDCAYCSNPNTNFCARYPVDASMTVMLSDGRTRFSAVDAATGLLRPVHHFFNTSTFAEFTVLDVNCVAKIPPAAPLERMCLLGCGISTGVGAAWNTANVTQGSTVAVFGLGAVGLAVAEGARYRKASKIIGIDINPDKFALGNQMGITDFVNPKDHEKPTHEVIRQLTGGGVDFSFECSGNLDVLREAFLSTHEGWGLTVMLGIHPSPRMLPLHPMEFFEGRRLVASIFGDFKGKSQLPSFAEKCGHGEDKINLEGFVTHELPFEEINKAFELLEQGKTLRKANGHHGLRQPQRLRQVGTRGDKGVDWRRRTLQL